MHRMHVINTLKKHMKGMFIHVTSKPTSLVMYDPHVAKKNQRPDTVWSVRVGLTKLHIDFFGGAQYSMYMSTLHSLKIRNKTIIINGSIRIPLEGQVVGVI